MLLNCSSVALIRHGLISFLIFFPEMTMKNNSIEIAQSKEVGRNNCRPGLSPGH